MTDHNILVFSGDWITLSGLVPVFPSNGLAAVAAGETLAFDIGNVGRWDTGLIAFLWDARRAAVAAGLEIDGATLPASARKLLGLLPDQQAEPVPASRRRPRPVSWIGGRTIGLLTELGILSTLLATTGQGGVRALAGRARMRAVDLLGNIRDAGPAALIIVSVVNFLIGAILAFVGAVQLRKFAADIYVANLVGLALVREMAAVMTAIVMAGRTGGAYAARIATMQGNEEIDALTVTRHPGGRLHPAAVYPRAGFHHAAALSVRMPGRDAGRFRGLHLDAEHYRRRLSASDARLRCRSINSCSGLSKASLSPC